MDTHCVLYKCEWERKRWGGGLQKAKVEKKTVKKVIENLFSLTF